LIWDAVLFVLLQGFNSFFNCLTRRYVTVLKNLLISRQSYVVGYSINKLHAILSRVINHVVEPVSIGLDFAASHSNS
jgi:hypothetical protein